MTSDKLFENIFLYLIIFLLISHKLYAIFHSFDRSCLIPLVWPSRINGINESVNQTSNTDQPFDRKNLINNGYQSDLHNLFRTKLFNYLKSE